MSGMEIIGGAAAIFQLVACSIRARSYLSDLAKKAENPSQSLEELSNQVESIIHLAKSITDPASQISPSDCAIRTCINKSTELQALLERICLNNPKNGREQKLGRMARRIRMAVAWKYRENEIRVILKEIDRSIAVLQIRLSCDNVEISRKTLKIVEDNGSNTLNINVTRTVQPAWMTQKASTLPPRNPQFVGQRVVLRELRRMLELTDPYTPCVAVVGLGGAGKSQLAIECAHQIQKESPETWIFLVRANNELEFELSYSEFASQTNINTADASLSVSCINVKNFLSSDEAGKWLMIVDGADDTDTFFGRKKLHKFLPQSKQGSIIFTSRNRQLALEFIPSTKHVIDLNHMDRHDAVEFLQTRLPTEISEYHMQHMLELIELLEGLPLALSQAVSFIITSCEGIFEYICLYRQSETSKIELLSEGGSHKDGSFTSPVAKTWQISFERIKKENYFAAHLLSLGACLHCRRIPTSLLSGTESPVKVTAALGLLRGYSMIADSSDGKDFHLHSLVQLATRHWLRSEAQLEKYAQLAFDAVYQNFPVDFERREQLDLGDRYSLHAQTVLGNNLSNVWDKSHVKLASRVSHYLSAKGDYDGALQYAKAAVDRSLVVYSKRDRYMLTTISDLGMAHWYLGEYQQAERLCNDVLELREQILGNEHEDTLASLNNLGLILHDEGKYEAAEKCHRRVLTLREKTLGPMHNETFKSLNNLGLSLKRQERFEEAEEVFRRVFTRRQKTLGIDHIGTLRSMNNLALVLQLRGKFEEAFSIHSEAFRRREILLGPKHPDTLKSKQNMAVVLMNQGRSEEAEEMIREVLGEYTKSLGPNHPDTLFAQSNLVIVLRDQGNIRDAEHTSRQVFEARKIKLGEDHPETIFSKEQADDLVRRLETPQFGSVDMD